MKSDFQGRYVFIIIFYNMKSLFYLFFYILQNSLRITYERADFSDVDPKILAEAFAECYPYNRTIRALHIRFKLKVNLDNDSTVSIKI